MVQFVCTSFVSGSVALLFFVQTRSPPTSLRMAPAQPTVSFVVVVPQGGNGPIESGVHPSAISR